MKLKPIESSKVRKEIHARVNEKDIELDELCYLIRRMLGKSQVDFAKMIGVSNKTINELENGKKIPSITILNNILRIAGLEIGVKPLD